jgi:hypothetical protein
MKASELRIGNFVTLSEKQRQELWYNQIHAQKEFFVVKTIYSDNDISIEVDDEIIDISENDVEPIPLTEEWLLKFGFIKEYNDDERENRDCFYLNNSDDSFYINYDISYNGWYLGASTYGFLKSFEHVHQLQNLYFALTNTELIWNGEK